MIYINQNNLNTAYIIDAVRTPVGRINGALSTVRPDDLLAITIKALLDRNKSIDIHTIESVIAGDGNQAGEDCRNVARMSSLLAGLPFSVTGNTVNCLCGSGMQAVIDAARAINCKDGGMYIAGGIENMSRAPMVISKTANNFNDQSTMIDSTIGWRFTNHKLGRLFQPLSMGETAEVVAKKYAITRSQQDEFAYHSHQKYFTALEDGKWDKEIIPVTLTALDDTIALNDEQPRKLTIEQLSRLKPLFDTTLSGTVTAGNSSGINDGAAAILIANEELVNSFNLKPKAKIIATAIAGVHPDEMGLGPVSAIHKLMKKTGYIIQDIDLFELNETFAATSIVCMQQLNIDPDKVNVLGGSLAIGHSVGSTGARIITTLIHEMERSNKKIGLASICVGLGQGLAVMVERC